MRCLNEWKAGDGNTYQLAQIDDFSQIPSDIINATSMTFYDKGRVGSCPAYVTDLGDLIFDLQTSIDADVTLKFLDTETISGVMGRYDYITSGRRMTGDQWIDLANNNVFKQGGWGNWGDGKIKYYIAVVVDDENERAYVFSIENTYSHWAGNTGWIVKVLGGKPNDVDLFFEIFGEPLSKSGGAGSGYIGNSLVSNKKMVGYNVPTSSAEATKTESVNEASAAPVSGKPKAGNGFARIKFLREPTWNVVGTWIDGKTIYEQDFDFHNANGIGVEDEFILDLPECERLFFADTCWINVNPPNENVRVFPFPYVHTNPEAIVGGFFGKEPNTNKPKFCFRRGGNTVVYDLYITVHFILK